MKITILQRDIAWSEPETNRRRADEVINRLSHTDLIVLPEMFSTGFATEPEGIAESDDSDTLRWMTHKADALDCAIAGSVAVKTGKGYANRFYFVKPGGDITFYDKHHLFTYGGEDRRFTAGNDKTIVEWHGVRIRLLVCYDLRFPVWSRNNANIYENGNHQLSPVCPPLSSPNPPYDLALYVASWPASRVDAWDILLRARAIENQCYVAGVNRVGEDPTCSYCGSSAIVDPYGRIAASCGRDVETEAEAVIDIEALEAFRKKFPVLKDADLFATE